MRAAALCSVGLLLGAHAQAASDSGGWTPISTAQGSVQFDAHVGRDPVRVRLGSASPSNSINESFVQTLKDAAAGTPQDSSVYDRPPLVQLPVTIASRRVVLPSVYRVTDMPYDLHLGRDFFSGHIVQIDYPNQRLRALDQDALALRKLANVPARRVDAETGTQVALNLAGHKVWAVIATEFSGALMVPRALAVEHGWLAEDATRVGAVVDAFGNELLSEGLKLAYVEFGPFRIDQVDTVILEEGESPLAGDDADRVVILGNDILRHFQLSLDLDRAYLHVQTPADD